MLKTENEWQNYLHTVTDETVLQDLITAIDSLMKAIKQDTTIQSLNLYLSEVPILRPFVEGKHSLYEVYIGITQKIVSELQKLEKFAYYVFPF